MKSFPRELMAVERLLEQQAPDGPSVALRSRTLDAMLNVLPIDSLPEQQPSVPMIGETPALSPLE